MRVFLDANILFSAAKSSGAVRELLRLLEEQGHECWADAYVAAEARRNQRSCASCHREDTCLACHSTLQDSRVPGGANPHPVDWLTSGRCRALVSANPRLCLKCHRDGSVAFSCM